MVRISHMEIPMAQNRLSSMGLHHYKLSVLAYYRVTIHRAGRREHSEDIML